MILECDEIYFASNEKSALTGQDGFSVRTYTRGMDTAAVSAAASACVKGYDVSPERQLNLEDLQANPRVVYDYPPAYSFSRFTDSAGSVSWVAGRTVYIATDYGFFLDTEGASRVGSNYFAHLMLFRSLPPAKLFAAMAGDSIFAPGDYTVSRDNAELRALLCGEAALLERRRVDISDAPVAADPRFMPVVKAVLTAWLNRRAGKEESMGKVIVKAPAAMTAGVMRALALMPDTLMENLTFVSNYMQGYGVPTGYDIAIVNEHNTRPLYEENYVVADLIADTTVNIPANPMFDAMDRAVASGRMVEFDRLLDLFLKTDHAAEPDYGFLLTVFRATMTPEGLTPADVTPEFVESLEKSRLAPGEKSAVYDRINEAIDNALLKADRPDAVAEAIRAAEAVRRYSRGGVTLTVMTRRRVTKMMLGVNAYLDHFVTDANVDTVITLMSRDDVADDGEFYAALAKTKSAAVWAALVRWYYSGNLDDIDTILNHLTASPLDPQARRAVVDSLYPMPASAPALYAYLLREPMKVTELPSVVRDLAEVAREEFFSGIIANSNDNLTVINGLDAGVTIYFRRRMAMDPNAAMKELIVFINKVKPVVYNSFTSSFEFVEAYLDHVEKTPGLQEKIILESLYPVRDIMSADAARRYEAVTDLYAGRMPKTVTADTIRMAMAMNASSPLVISLFDKWIDSGVTPDMIRDLAKSLRRLAPDVMAAAVTAVWTKCGSDPKRRSDAVLALTDNVEWPKDCRQNFIATCPDKELAAFLGDSDKLLNKLFRRFKNIF